jgi:hypothetical protein
MIKEKEKCEIISHRMGQSTSRIAQLDIHIGNYQVMTLVAYIYSHFINTQLNKEKDFFRKKVNNLVQDNIINMFKRQGMPISDKQSYKAGLSSCLQEWNDQHMTISRNKDTYKTTTTMICNYFDSENIDFSESHKQSIYNILKEESLKNEDEVWDDYSKAASSSGCMVVFMLLSSSVMSLIYFFIVLA